VTVLAARPSGALAAAEALVPELTQSAGAVVTVRAAEAAGAGLARSASRLRGCPPAQPVAVAADDHDELAVLGRSAGQRPGHADPEPFGRCGGSDGIVVPRRRPVLEHRQHRPGQAEPFMADYGRG
jgi:hypothetical protein